MDFVDLTQFRITTPFALPEIIPYSSGTADSGRKSHQVSLHVTTRPLRIRVITTVTRGVRDLAGITRSLTWHENTENWFGKRRMFEHEQLIDRVLPACGNHGKRAMQYCTTDCEIVVPVTCHLSLGYAVQPHMSFS